MSGTVQYSTACSISNIITFCLTGAKPGEALSSSKLVSKNDWLLGRKIESLNKLSD